MKTDRFPSQDHRRPKALIGRGRVSGIPLSATLDLARALRDSGNMSVAFALQTDKDLAAIHHAGFAGHLFQSKELAGLVRARKPDLLILSGAGVTRGEAETLRRDCLLMAAVEEESEARFAYDFVYYPPLPRFQALGWAGARTVPRIGWDYVLPGRRPGPAGTPALRLTLLVSMEDPGLTERAARLLSPLDFRIRFVIGPNMQDGAKLAAAIVAMKSNYETVEGADDLSTEYASADLVLCRFGRAAYDLAVFGLPALYLSKDQEDALSAAVFDAAGMAMSLGLAGRAADADILAAVKTLMSDAGQRREMRARALTRVDGHGAEHIAADLASALREEKPFLKLAQ
jgi:spore coat polysaccharide biosynthesis predicted glycosyltransferase SpsG